MALNRLLILNKMGIVPGVEETEEQLFRRADYCLSLSSSLCSQVPNFPFEFSKEDTVSYLENPSFKTAKLFDINPQWIPIFFSNYQLALWHGGCAWIFQLNEDTPTGAFFQLRRSLRHSTKYLGIYQRDELIAHELIHVGRMLFREPKFEEILAYQTSSSPFRRWFGPIVQSSLESLCFVLLIFLIFIVDLFLVLNGYTAVFKSLMWVKVLPVALIGLAVGRLWHRHRSFSKCLAHINSLLHDERKSRATVYRLTDKEIFAFAKMSPLEIQAYAESSALVSLRWKVITEAYFQDNS